MLSALRHAWMAIIRSAPAPSYRWAVRTRWPSSRKIRVQRILVLWFPDRDDERAGMITTIFMNENPVYRPTSGATADELAAQLRGIRTCTRRVTDDLSMRQLMGPMLPIVNPILWEIGHVGWFHEYWTLRHAHGEAPILDRADRLWNSSTVAHATRWDLDLPDRNGVFGYMADVLGRQLDRLGGGIELPACYFYDLSIGTRICTSRRSSIRDRRSDTRGPNVLAIRQVIAPGHGEATSRCPAGAGGSARPPPMASFSTTRSGRTRSTSRRSGLPRRRLRMPSLPRSSTTAVIAGGNSGARRAGPGASA